MKNQSVPGTRNVLTIGVILSTLMLALTLWVKPVLARLDCDEVWHSENIAYCEGSAQAECLAGSCGAQEFRQFVYVEDSDCICSCCHS